MDQSAQSDPLYKRRHPWFWVYGKWWKLCTGCNEVREEEDYYRDPQRANGRKSKCRFCVSGRAGQWNRNNHERKMVMGRKSRDRRARRAGIIPRDLKPRKGRTKKFPPWRIRADGTAHRVCSGCMLDREEYEYYDHQDVIRPYSRCIECTKKARRAWKSRRAS